MEERSTVINVNCGILGHVDSGKTSLVKALSTSLSTCALDKHPQSQQRGITLDLGFSAFTLAMPEHLKSQVTHDDMSLQFTLVDCPGHASLIRTIIGGAQIIDMMLLVVDANKGIQTQTAECIVIGEITTDNLIIVLNKIDSLPAEDREARLEKVTARIRKTFAGTKFKDAPIIPTAAAVGGERVAALTETKIAAASINSSSSAANVTLSSSQSASYSSNETIGIDTLVDLIRRTVQLPSRNTQLPFYFAIDHCFPIKGHGTILTGTVLSGSVAINTTIELPDLQQTRKVKSMQMFRRPVKAARQGDRVGICVTNLDSALIERGIATAPSSVPLISSALCLVKKVRFFKAACRSEAKYHVSIGHTTLVAEVIFFGAKELHALQNDDSGAGAVDDSPGTLDTRGGVTDTAKHKALNATYRRMFPSMKYDFAADFHYQDELTGNPPDGSPVVYGSEPLQWALLRFQQAVYCPLDSLIIGSRLDAVTREGAQVANQCRLAFFGPIVHSLTDQEVDSIQIYNWKQKGCEVFKTTDVKDGLVFEIIAWRLFSEGGSLKPFLGMMLETDEGHKGVITAPFGAGGKFKVKFAAGVPRSKMTEGSPLVLRFKRFLNDKLKQMRQTPEDSGDMGTVAPEDHAPIKEAEQDLEAPTPSDKKKSSISVVPQRPSPVPTPAIQDISIAAQSEASRVHVNSRIGNIESLKDEVEGSPGLFTTAIVTGAFRIEENIKLHCGSAALGPNGQKGEVKGPFAKLGKCKVLFKDGCAITSIGGVVSIVLKDN